MNKTIYLILILIGVVGIWYYSSDSESEISINSFDECVDAGYPVMESYPEQCATPDGQSFTNDVETGLSAEDQEQIESKSDLIKVDNPQPLAEVSSPLEISGEARGQWYFEADFPVRIQDDAGNLLGEHYVTAEGDWMTTDFVNFSGELSFVNPTTGEGMLVFERANPSGLAENVDELRIPIKFSDVVSETRPVKLYYYDAEQDTDAEGNVMCTAAGLVELDRYIPMTMTPAQDVIRLLISGDLSEAEADQGISTEFPLPGLELEGAELTDGVLTLNFADPNNATSGGSCRTNILWAQIEATALQFDTVTEVRYSPETLFQP